MNGWHAFLTGLRRALRYPQVWLVVFVVNLFSALLLVVPPALGLASGLGQRPAIFAAADGLDAWLVIETLMSSLADAALGESGSSPSLTLLLAPLLIFLLPAGLAALCLSQRRPAASSTPRRPGPPAGGVSCGVAGTGGAPSCCWGRRRARPRW